MCGLAGLVFRTPSCVDPTLVHAIRQSMAHRGPDDWGVLTYHNGQLNRGRNLEGPTQADVMLMHLRLSILDVSEGGWQPMASADGRFFIVFNGEVYNFLELRAELASKGRTFATTSDTEVLLAGFAEWGPGILSRIIGMFAFVVLDTWSRKVFFARDQFGIKPLYITSTTDTVAFASEIPTLLAMVPSARRANPDRLYSYLRYGITDQGDATMFAGVHQLPAAHYCEMDLDTGSMSAPVCYWTPNLGVTRDISFAEAANALRDLFLESVGLHLRSDVPLGAALSGGIDSTAILAVARHLLGSGADLHAFSFVPTDSSLSEEHWIDLAAKASNATVHKVRPTADELVRDIDSLIRAQGEPFTSTSMYAQYRVFRCAHEAGIKVMLNGQGADELLGGYRTFIGARLASLVRSGSLLDASRLLSRSARLPGSSGTWLAMVTADFLLPDRFQSPFRRIARKDLAPAWMNWSWFADRGVVARSPRATEADLVLRHELHRTMTHTNLPHLLRYEDRNSMRFSIESRVPFLTPALAEFVLTLPESHILDDNGTSKSVFRAAMRGIVPDAILDRKDKVGFATPQQEWLVSQRNWIEKLLAPQLLDRVPVLERDALRTYWTRLSAGDTANSHHAWRWINVLAWTEAFDVLYA